MTMLPPITVPVDAVAHAGTFKRKTESTRVTVTVRPEVDLTSAERDGIAEAAEFLAAFHALPLNLVVC